MNNGKIWGSSACNQRRLLCFVISIVFVFTSVLPPLSAGADSDTSIPPDPGPAITDESYITVEPPVSSVGTSADPGVISDTTSGSGTISETDTISDIGATSGSGSGTTSEPGPDMTSGPGSGMVPETEFGITADTEIGPILFDGWNNSYDGVIKANYYWVGAAFISTGESEIESIEFEISTDDANWSLIPPGMIYSEYEDYNSELNGMYRELELDFTDYIDYISYDTLYIRARATDKEGNKRTETTALTVDVLYVNNLKAEPNEENNAIVLTWENPVEENFSHAIVKRLEKYGGGYKSSEPTPADYGGSGSWWYLDSTAENTYIDRDVSPYKEYRYRVIAVDDEWYEGIPVEATAQLVTTGPVMLAYWDIGNDGKVNAYYVDDYSICAYFYALDEIRSIDYEISSDNLNWTAIPTEWILYDYDLYYDDWRNTWGRYIEIDLTDYGQGDLYIRATARDENSVTATATAHLVIDLVCEAATDCSAAPNEDNTAIELSWSVPDDYDYAELYRENYNGMPWGCIDELTGTTYTDTNINKDNPYITYRYKIIIYDKHGNKSLETQPFSARLNTPGPISLKDFSTDIEDGRINRNDASRCYLSASFFSEKPLTQIQYDYSIDGTTWHDLRPFISEDQRLQREEKDFYYWRFIRMNIGPNSGVPDGPISIRATAVDEDGNSLEAKVDLVKDATPPQPVIDISAVPKEDNTGIVLTWTNPTDEDFKYLVINRGSYTSITPVDFNGETFTDTEVEVGTEYTYKFITYDEFGNASLIQPEIKISILTDGPVIDTMYPDDGIRTNADTLSYSARFRSSLAVERIHFEISNDDGESWTTLRDVVPEKTYNEYYSSGSWDISEIGEETWLLRATAYDKSGRSSSETRTIHIDHVAPPPPTNFKAEITSTSPNTICFSWDPVENAQRYSLSRIYANPADGSYNPSYTIYAPDTTAELSYDIKSETPYIFTIMAQDLAGNWGDPISLPYVVEIFTGPSITFDKGYVVYTNETDYVLSGKVEPGVVVAIYDKTKGGDFQPLSTDEEGNFSYSTVLSSENSGNNDFTIRAEKGGLTHTVKHRAVYDTTPPKISSFSPDDGNLVTGKKAKISLSISGSSASIARKTVQITQDDVNWYDVIEIPPDKNEVYWDTTVPVEGLGILEDGTYKVRAFILDKAGNQTEGPPRLWILDNTKPEPPTGLTITPEIGKNKLNWSASASGDLRDSSPYTVYRSTESGGYQQLAVTKNTYYEDTTAQYGVVYYYVVTATDKAGNVSIYSNEAASQVAADTTPPVFTSFPPDGSTYGNRSSTQMYFTQNLVATDNSAKGVKQFVLEYSNDNGATWKSFTSGASLDGDTYKTTFTIYTAGMTHGEYLFRYSAIDYAGNTVTTPTITGTVDVIAYPVQNLSARPGEASVILEWDLPVERESGAFQIYRSNYFSGGYQMIKDYIASTEQSFTDKSVAIGNLYYYKVTTRDSYYNYADSDIVWAIPTDDLTPPEITSVDKEDESLLGGDKISIVVEARDNKAVKEFTFTGSQDGGASWKSLQVIKSDEYVKPDNTYRFSYNWNPAGLDSGEIIVRITAKDTAGNPSEPVERTWILDLEVSPPTNLRTTSGDGTVLIEWDPVPDPDLNSDYAYRVYRSSKPGGRYDPISSYLSQATLSYVDKNVETGSTYYYVVESRDIVGNVARSEEIAASPAGDEIPPHIDRAEPKSGSTVGGETDQRLRFYASDNAGYLGATAVFEYSADGGSTWVPVSDSYAGPAPDTSVLFYFTDDWDLRELATGEYKVRYTVTDAAGNSTQMVADYTVDRTPPSPPKNLTANYGSLNIGLGWEIPEEADVEGYRVYRSLSPDKDYERIEDIEGKDKNSFVDDHVSEGILYYYRVTALDSFNQEGQPSNTASAAAVADEIPPEVILMEPDYFTVIGAKARITVTATDNSALSSITLEYLDEDTESWIPINTIATLDTAVFDWSTAGLSGEIKVRAIAKDSAGNMSDKDDGKAIKIYIIDNEGPAVTGLRGTGFGGDIVLEWDLVTDSDFAYFLVEKKDERGFYRELDKVRNVLGFHVKGLEPETDYHFRVSAFDKAGNTGPASEITVNSGNDTIPPQVNITPGTMRNHSGNKSILITGFEVVDNVGVNRIKVEYTVDEITWIEIGCRTLDVPEKKVKTAEPWDVSELPDGIYYVRVQAEDTAGNWSEPSDAYFYIVDHIDPEAPYGIELISTAGYVDIMWKYNAEADFAYFELYRSETIDGIYEVISPIFYEYLRYLDRDVEEGKTYFYKVAAFDIAGNRSEYSEIVSGGLTEDRDPPYLSLYSPRDSAVLAQKTHFEVNVADDSALETLLIEIRASGDEEGEWITVLNKEYDPEGTAAVTTATEKFAWDTKDFAEGWYDIRYQVIDKAGNVTGPLIMTHMLNNTPPEAPVLFGEPGGWSSSLIWTGDEPEDFNQYIVYRSAVLGGTFKPVGWLTERNFVDTRVQPGIRYYYYVRAYDIYGNYSQSNTINIIPTNEDLEDPVANAGDDLILTVGLEAYFDGTLSIDNDRIASYSWDFGDGATSSAARPVHSYSEPGEYTASLTVSDPAGNTHTDTVSVKVVSPDEVGILEVRVINDVTGELISGASVVIDYPDGATLKTTTNLVGAAFVVAPPGDYQVYAYKTDLKPNSERVTMVKGKRDTLMIRLSAGSVITGELKAERMTLDEIIAAGIDVSDPDNRQAYQFEIGLSFINQPIIATKNRFVPPRAMPKNLYISDDGQRIYIFELVDPKSGGGDGDGDGRILIGQKLDMGGAGDSAIAFMIIPGRTTWLKEFFDIGLTIQNGADPEYTIEDACAKLTLPDGLSLAPTREGQHLYIDMGSIAGGESASVNWIVRGDKRGEYRLEAEFNGVIMPFGDTVIQKFRNEEPFRVWANNALKMHVQAQDRADKGYPYELKIGVENVSDTPLYNVDLELLEETKVNFIYAPNQKLKQVFEELDPGSIRWLDYQLIPAIDGELLLDNSFVARTGGEADIETDTTSFSVPENAVGTAPVLTQVNKGDGTVDLSWDPVEGATEYKIYRVRQDLNISMEPKDLVYSCGPDVLSVTLDERDGPRDYVMKTVTAEGESMRHAMTGFSWIDYQSEATLTIYPEKIIVNRTTDLLFTARRGGALLKSGRVELEEMGISGLFTDPYHGPVPQITLAVTPEQTGPVTVKLYDWDGFLLEKTIQVVLPDPPAQPRGLNGAAGDRKVNLTWFPNDELELAGYHLYLIQNNGWTKIHTGIIESNSYEVTGLNDNTVYTFQVSAVDIYGRESIMSDPFQIGIGIPEDTIAPWVIGTLPANQQEEVSLNTQIKVFFNEDIEFWRSYEDIQVLVNHQPIGFEEGFVHNVDVLTLTLDEPLPLKAHCVVIIPQGAVRDKNFNELSEEYRFEFFTGADKDSIAPVLAGISPRENAQSVSVHSDIILYFSESIAAGASFGDLTVTADGNPVPFTAEVTGSKIILTPSVRLPYDAAIQVTVPADAVADGAGNSLADTRQLLFYTAGVPDADAPRVVSMVPSANSTEVPLNAEINIYFSEKIRAGEHYSEIAIKDGSQALSADIAISGNALKIKPAGALSANKLYSIELPAGAVRDLSDNPLVSPYSAVFTTGEDEDHQSPELLSATPESGEKGVALNTSVKMRFDENIQPGDSFGDILLMTEETIVNFEAYIDGDSLVLTPDVGLPAGCQLQVVIPSGALKDISGNCLASQEKLTFATASGGGDEDPIDECFIATAAYGSKFEPSVALLRSFRDDYLLTNGLGKAFVEFYYNHSPAVARFIAESHLLRAGTRLLLSPAVILVYLLYHPELSLLLIPAVLLAIRYRRNRKWTIN